MANDIGNNNAMVPPPPMPPSVASVSRRGGGSIVQDFWSPKLCTNSCVRWQIYTTFAHRSSSAWNSLERNIIVIYVP